MLVCALTVPRLEHANEPHTSTPRRRRITRHRQIGGVSIVAAAWCIRRSRWTWPQASSASRQLGLRLPTWCYGIRGRPLCIQYHSELGTGATNKQRGDGFDVTVAAAASSADLQTTCPFHKGHVSRKNTTEDGDTCTRARTERRERRKPQSRRHLTISAPELVAAASTARERSLSLKRDRISFASIAFANTDGLSHSSPSCRSACGWKTTAIS